MPQVVMTIMTDETKDSRDSMTTVLLNLYSKAKY